MSWLDLHMHSDYSDDGEFSPAVLMELCQRSGVRAAALADHNTTRGVREAEKAAAALGITLIPAIELDCVCQGVNLHLLGYWIDPEDEGFARVEQSVEKQALATSAQRVELVRALGIPFRDGDLACLAQGGAVTGEMLAEAAMSLPENRSHPLLAPYFPGGERDDNPYVNFYWDFCAQGKPAYVPMEFISLSEAVTLIRKSGGVPILAHPSNNVREDTALLAEIVRQSVAGLEVYSSYHTAEQTAFYLEQAQAMGLLRTCGSDFHGKIKPRIKLGSVDCGGAEDAIFDALLAQK